MKPYHFVCAAVLAVAPMAAMAQTTASPSAGVRTQSETADVKPGSAAKSNPAHPGATGKTVVPGTHSSAKADRPATTQQKAGPSTSGGK
ncbi:hypothetical protein [Rhodopila sp.]|uniref:hypothetical protein n=1 Tax=Rhodopila sp. TaxID=2480087 RepID=UPI003D0B0B77